MPVRLFREFIKLESSAGAVLLVMAVIAMILDNSPWQIYYHAVFGFELGFHIGPIALKKPLHLWINEGLMSVFFLLVGLEIKREMVEGELSSLRRAALPAIAAVGGMVVPALIYVLFNYHNTFALQGWAIPTATDIAFSLGILAVLGSRVPPSMKIFLTALAIFDDIAGIAIIAAFYTSDLSYILLLSAAGIILILFLLNRLHVVILTPYVILGGVLWLVVLKSGVHATLSGVVVALAIPVRDRRNPEHSPAKQLEHWLNPWVAFGVLPLFALANAGISFSGLTVSELLGTIPLGIALGLFIGKQLGIWGASFIAIKAGFAHMPSGGSWAGIYGVSLVAGVGFTMSLFIGGLAFGKLGHYDTLVRIGVISGSLISGLLGYLFFRFGMQNKLANI